MKIVGAPGLGDGGLMPAGPRVVLPHSQPVTHASASVSSLRISRAPGALTTSEVQLLQNKPESAAQSARQRLSNASLEISYKAMVPPAQAPSRGHREPGSWACAAVPMWAECACRGVCV